MTSPEEPCDFPRGAYDFPRGAYRINADLDTTPTSMTTSFIEHHQAAVTDPYTEHGRGTPTRKHEHVNTLYSERKEKSYGMTKLELNLKERQKTMPVYSAF